MMAEIGDIALDKVVVNVSGSPIYIDAGAGMRKLTKAALFSLMLVLSFFAYRAAWSMILLEDNRPSRML